MLKHSFVSVSLLLPHAWLRTAAPHLEWRRVPLGARAHADCLCTGSASCVAGAQVRVMNAITDVWSDALSLTGMVLGLSREQLRRSRLNLSVVCSGDLLNLRSTLTTLLNKCRSDLEIFCTAQSLRDGSFSSLMNKLAERADQEP